MPHARRALLPHAAGACERHLGKLGRHASLRTALSNDLLLLVCAVRAAVLWDYWSLDGVAEDDGQWSTNGSAIQLSQLLSFLDDLKASSPEAAVLEALCIGASVFVVNAVALRGMLECGPGADLGELGDLVAVDAHLPAPRLCSAEERQGICAGLSELSATLLDACARRPLGGPGRQPSELLVRLPCPRPAPLMVAVHGWLLGYPSVYCHAAASPRGEGQESGEPLTEAAAVSDGLSDGPAAGNATCLSGHTLSVCVVTVQRRLSGLRLPETAPAAPQAAHRVCSFSLPAASGAPLERPSVHAWWAGMQARFASAECAALWEEPRLEVQVREGIGVAL